MDSRIRARPWTEQEHLACVEAVRYVLRTTSNRIPLVDLYNRVSDYLVRHYSIQRSMKALDTCIHKDLSFLVLEINNAMRQKPVLSADDDHKEDGYEQNSRRSALLAPHFPRDEDHLLILTWSERELDSFFRPRLSDIHAGWSPAPQV